MNKPIDERVLFAALDEATDFILVSDDTAADAGGPRLIYVNRSFLDATGFAVTEVIGSSYHHLISPENPRQLIESIVRAIDMGQENNRELMFRRKDGTDFWVELVGKQFRTDDRIYRLTVARDITLRRRSLYQVALLFAATEQSSDAIALYEPLDGSWQMTYENEEAYRRGTSRLPQLLEERPAWKESLESRGAIHEFFAELDEAANPVLREFHARAIRSDAHIEAIVTLERALTSQDDAGHENYESRLLRVAAQLTSLASAQTHTEHLAILRAILLDAFDANVERSQTAALPSVQLNVEKREGSFRLGNESLVVTWKRPLERTALTAMRFCIEAAIEQEGLPNRRVR